MVRALTSNFITHSTAAECKPILFFEGVFNSGTVRYWNGIGPLLWNSQTWTGNGWFQGFEGLEETTEVEVTDMVIILSGIPTDVLSLVLADQVQGALGKLWIGFLDSAEAVVTDPYLAGQGLYSHSEVNEDGEVCTVKLVYESRMTDMDKPREGRWTNECQQEYFPGDKGFEYVVAASRWKGQWNDKKQKVNKGSKRNSGKRGSGKKN